jgi:hypothetical protein
MPMFWHGGLGGRIPDQAIWAISGGVIAVVDERRR